VHNIARERYFYKAHSQVRGTFGVSIFFLSNTTIMTSTQAIPLVAFGRQAAMATTIKNKLAPEYDGMYSK
jgi:hypothetical protein